MHFQPPESPIVIDHWQVHEDFGIFPTGTKPKKLLICPMDAPEPYLIPGRAYILKQPTGWREQQIWSEVIAYRLAAEIGLPVPPCHIAIDTRTGSTGALVEFFYEYPNQTQTTRVVHGADLLNFVRRPTDGVRPHDIASNIRAHKALRLRGAQDWWARTVFFDALIGNTDRHTENWGAIQVSNNSGHYYDFAPIYDNGTSLGYQQTESSLVEFWKNPEKIELFLKAGTHDCGIKPNEDGPMSHIFLCKRFLDEFEGSIEAARSVIRFEQQQVDKIVGACTGFRVGVRFTPERAVFVLALIAARRRKLEALLGG